MQMAELQEAVAPPGASSSYYAAQHIRKLIFEGKLRPGQRIPQDEVAQALHISRIPVREAIIALEREGFVTTVLHRGAFVDSLDEQAVRDQYDLYGIIYAFAAQRALERSSRDFLDTLRTIEAELARTDDPSVVGELSLAFHRTVVAAAKSPRVKVVIRALPGLRPSEFFALVPGSIEAQQAGIRAVLEALEADDRPRVLAAYGAVMEHTGDHVVELFRQRGLFTTAEDGLADG
jgi:DNA-binding GntR family transcriptional regulator